MNEIVIKKLAKFYKDKQILNDINLELNSKNIIGLIGGNGEGKTTLLKCIAKEIPFDVGTVYCNGKEDFHQLTDVLLIPDNIILPQKMKIGDVIKMFESNNSKYDRKYVEEFLEFLGLECSQKIEKLSKGNQEILQIGMLIANKPNFLLLDEPLASVDVVKRDFLYDKIIDLNADGVGIILTSHIVSEIQNLFSEIIILKNNKIEKRITTDEIYESGYEDLNTYIKEIIK